MNKITYLVCLLLVHATCISQSASSLVGKWTLYCYSDDELYFNLKTDSFSVSDELKQMYPEPEKQKQLVAIQAHIWRKLQYHFGNDGKYRSFLFNDTLPMDQGKYREDKKLGIIECEFVGGDGIIRTEKMTYQIKEQSLYLKMSWRDPPVLFIMERKPND